MSVTRTFTIVKPDAVNKGYVGPILNIISEKGFHLTALKMIRMNRAEAEHFYAVHKNKPFFEDLVRFMISGPVVVGILEKENAVADYRKLMGSTDPVKADEGTLRKRFAENMQRNAVHGSDSDENAETECNFFFSESERFTAF